MIAIAVFPLRFVLPYRRVLGNYSADGSVYSALALITRCKLILKFRDPNERWGIFKQNRISMQEIFQICSKTYENINLTALSS